MTAYPHRPPPATALPIRSTRHAILIGFIAGRCGRVSLTRATFTELRGLGLTYGATMAAVEQLEHAGRVRVRRLVDGVAHVELLPLPSPAPAARGTFHG